VTNQFFLSVLFFSDIVLNFSTTFGAAEIYTSETLFAIPWSTPATAAAGTTHGLRLLIPTQVSADFQPSIKGPGGFDVDLEGNIYMSTNAQRPPEVRKYNPKGELLWTIRGALERDFDSVPLEVRKFAEIGETCCDDEGNLYVTESLDYHEDKVAKYDKNGQFREFVRTGLRNPIQLRRHPGGGIAFLATMNNAPSGVAYPAVFKDNSTSRDPGAGKPKDATGRTYSGEFVEKYLSPVGHPTTGPKYVQKDLGREVVLLRNPPRKKDKFWEWEDEVVLEILVPYPFTIYGQHIVASDSWGHLYLDLYLKDDLLTADQRDRIVKVDPISRQIVAEIMRYPAEKTMDLTHRDPVVVPETGDVYEFYDLPDGLHVVKFSPNE